MLRLEVAALPWRRGRELCWHHFYKPTWFPEEDLGFYGTGPFCLNAAYQERRMPRREDTRQTRTEGAIFRASTGRQGLVAARPVQGRWVRLGKSVGR